MSRTPESVKGSLSKDQFKLYKLIWERFISSQMAPAIYDTVTVSISAGDYILRVSGSVLKFKGFMAVYTEGTDEEVEEKEDSLPELKKGQVLKLLKLLPEQHFTQPPPCALLKQCLLRRWRKTE